jgi:hypothetical protein
MTVNLIATVDVDNDGIALKNERNHLSWQGVERLPDIKRVFESIGAPVTWFVRADNQLREVYDSAAYLYQTYGHLWRDLANTGDEIAWHPHLYEWEAHSCKYVVDTDEMRCAFKLREIHAELKAQELALQSVRVGEAFHGNALMHSFCELGLRVDSSAIPGRRRTDEARTFDWLPTPNEPYFPSQLDYRIPGEKSEQLPILEVPLTTMPVRAPYDSAPLRRYINLTYHHHLFRDAFSAHLENIDGAKGKAIFITMILHPEEVCNGSGKSPALYSYSLKEVVRNLTFILETLEALSHQVRFLRMKDTVAAISRG